MRKTESITLEESNISLHAYGCKNPLKLKGKFRCKVYHRDNSVAIEVYVVSNRNSGCLLGRDTAKKLGVLKIEVRSVIERSTWNKQTITENYPSIIQGVGRLKDTQVSIRIDKDIKPIKQAYRRVPFHLTCKLESKLKDFEAMDLIEDVEPSKVTWISPMVVVPKPSGDVRVCIDMRLANTAIIRDTYPIPTLDELCQDMHG